MNARFRLPQCVASEILPDVMPSDLLLKYPLVKYLLVKYLVKKNLVNKCCIVKYLVDTQEMLKMLLAFSL